MEWVYTPRMNQPAKRVHITLGGAASHRKAAADVPQYNQHSAVELGIDGQVPLGFSIGQRAARAGLFGIARGFRSLELQQEGRDPIVLRRQLEAGISFSTDPVLRIWKFRLPWIAVGYQFGHTVSVVRIYATFPFLSVANVGTTSCSGGKRWDPGGRPPPGVGQS